MKLIAAQNLPWLSLLSICTPSFKLLHMLQEQVYCYETSCRVTYQKSIHMSLTINQILSRDVGGTKLCYALLAILNTLQAIMNTLKIARDFFFLLDYIGVNMSLYYTCWEHKLGAINKNDYTEKCLQ